MGIRKDKSLPRIVIIGAGFAGLRAAQNLKNVKAQITVMDGSNHHLFQPLLYQVATAGLSPADIASPIRSVLQRQKNVEVVLEKVTDVDIKAKVVISSDGHRTPYDYLVVACGARHSYFNHGDWEKFAPGLKSVADATRIRRNILLAFENAEIENDPVKKEAWLTFAIVGGGPTGVELAGALAELSTRTLPDDFRHIDPTKARIYLIEAGERVLAGFPPDLSSKAQRHLEKLGVKILLNKRVDTINDHEIGFGAEKIPARTVIWAAGVAALQAGKWLKADVDKAGRVKVDGDLSVPGLPEVFVVGDTALTLQDGKPLPGVAPVAMQQGNYVAEVLKSLVQGKNKPKDFRYVDKGNLATIGRSYAIADLGKIHLAGRFAWLTWIVVHIYYLIGFRNRMLVLVQWGWAWLTFQKGARLIVAADKEGAPET